MSKATISVNENGNLHIHIPMFVKRSHGRKIIYTPQTLEGDNADMPDIVQSAVAQSLARAFSWAELLESGKVKSVAELARSLYVDGSYISRTLKLTTLAPDIIEAILNGEEPDGLSLSKLVLSFPLDWEEQRAHFGFK
ncbi:hypothetical protein EGM51_00875 [Verrucomicrobia bacterium S94]|nr:hypothetical protein EGM51_00875 [Verrucomicrobia bacterium S94]